MFRTETGFLTIGFWTKCMLIRRRIVIDYRKLSYEMDGDLILEDLDWNKAFSFQLGDQEPRLGET